jgi:hypothetical protein
MWCSEEVACNATFVAFSMRDHLKPLQIEHCNLQTVLPVSCTGSPKSPNASLGNGFVGCRGRWQRHAPPGHVDCTILQNGPRKILFPARYRVRRSTNAQAQAATEASLPQNKSLPQRDRCKICTKSRTSLAPFPLKLHPQDPNR